MQQKYRLILTLSVLVLTALTTVVSADENELTFVLGTDANYQSLVNVSATSPVNITIYNPEDVPDLSNRSVVFLASLNDSTLSNLTVNNSADICGYNLTNTSLINTEDNNITRYWMYGGDENIDRLITYMNVSFYAGSGLIEPPIPPVNKVNITILSSSDYIESGINRVFYQDQIINDTMNVNVYLALSYPNVTLPDDFDLSDQDIIIIDHVSQPVVEHINDLISASKNNGAYVITTGFADVYEFSNVNMSCHPYIEQYIKNPCEGNYGKLLMYLGTQFGGLNGEIKPPNVLPNLAIYHPDSGMYFEERDAYLNWYGTDDGTHYVYDSAKPTIGIYFGKGSYSSRDLRVEDLLIRNIEDKGCNVIPIFHHHQYNFKDFFMKNGTEIVDSIITIDYRMNWGNFTQGQEDAELLNVPWLQGIKLYKTTPDEWNDSIYGVPSFMSYYVSHAELDGIIEPIVVGGKVTSLEGDKYYEPIDFQVEWLADRAIAWANLHRKDNAEKKIVIPFYSEGGGKANPGADIDYYLDAPASLENLLNAMKDRGYDVGTEPIPDKAEIAKLLQESSNVGTWAPGVLEERAKSGNSIVIPESKYLEWFNELPQDKRDEVIERFGTPPGEIMVYENESGKYIVIPKIQFGNILIAPHPTWGFLQNDTTLYYDGAIPPHHEYLAFYSWIHKEYHPDAMYSIWTQMPLMPGKIIGISKYDWGGILLEDMPHIHTLKVDMDSGIKNKRRVNAVIVDYITPPIIASGLYENLTMLQDKIWLYDTDNEMLKETYKDEIIDYCIGLNIDHDLNVNLTATANNTAEFEGFLLQLSRYLNELKGTYMPYGSHTLSEPPTGDKLVAMIMSMLGDDFDTHVSIVNSSENTTTLLLNACLFDNLTPNEAQNTILGEVHGDITDDLNLAIDYANRIDACTIEISRILDALEGKYIPPGPGHNDPIRNPDVLPTGRNTYSFDERIFPTKAAWGVGVNITDQLLSQHLGKNGEYPRKVAFVLWSSETGRHQGVMESEILYLMGVKPVWNQRGRPSSVELISSEELGRPRIDVVVVTSGTYRQMWQTKVKMIDNAVRLAAQNNSTAYPNYVQENSVSLKSQLIAKGYNESLAEMVSMSRVFSEAIGTTTPNLQFAVPASNTWENDTKLADLYISRESYIYGENTWGELHLPDLFEDNLRDVEIGVFSRSTNNYGILDHPMVASYFGGLGLAVRSLTGETPDMYINNLRESENPKVDTLDHFFNRELRTRNFNPEWIKGMMEHGYDGTRYMAQFTEDLWMWTVVTPDVVTDAMWKEVYDIYVADKYDLGMKNYFDTNNPYAYQSITAQMLDATQKLDADNNPYWDASDEILQNLVKEYVESVVENGVTCCHHTCGNPLLDKYIQGMMSVAGISAADQETYKNLMNEATQRETSSDSTRSKRYNSGSSTDTAKVIESGSGNQTIESDAGYGTSADRAQEASMKSPPDNYVEGYEMTKDATPDNAASQPSFSGSDVIGAVLVLLSVGAIFVGFRRRGI